MGRVCGCHLREPGRAPHAPPALPGSRNPGVAGGSEDGMAVGRTPAWVHVHGFGRLGSEHPALLSAAQLWSIASQSWCQWPQSPRALSRGTSHAPSDCPVAFPGLVLHTEPHDGTSARPGSALPLSTDVSPVTRPRRLACSPATCRWPPALTAVEVVRLLRALRWVCGRAPLLRPTRGHGVARAEPPFRSSICWNRSHLRSPPEPLSFRFPTSSPAGVVCWE